MGTISISVKTAIDNQGRKKSWVADQLQISRPTLDSRLVEDDWKPEEITILKSIGLLI